MQGRGLQLCVQASQQRGAIIHFSLCRVSYRVGARPFHHLGVVAGGGVYGGGGVGGGVETVKVFTSVITQRCFPLCVCVCVCGWGGHSLGLAVVRKTPKGQG